MLGKIVFGLGLSVVMLIVGGVAFIGRYGGLGGDGGADGAVEVTQEKGEDDDLFVVGVLENVAFLSDGGVVRSGDVVDGCKVLRVDRYGVYGVMDGRLQKLRSKVSGAVWGGAGSRAGGTVGSGGGGANGVGEGEGVRSGVANERSGEAMGKEGAAEWGV